MQSNNQWTTSLNLPAMSLAMAPAPMQLPMFSTNIPQRTNDPQIHPQMHPQMCPPMNQPISQPNWMHMSNPPIRPPVNLPMHHPKNLPSPRLNHQTQRFNSRTLFMNATLNPSLFTMNSSLAVPMTTHLPVLPPRPISSRVPLPTIPTQQQNFTNRSTDASSKVLFSELKTVTELVVARQKIERCEKTIEAKSSEIQQIQALNDAVCYERVFLVSLQIA